MILGFRHKGLERFHRTGVTTGIQPAYAPKLRRILAVLEVARVPQDMRLPGFGLHPLIGDLVGHWAVGVNGNFRVTFRFAPSGVEGVDYLDYH